MPDTLEFPGMRCAVIPPVGSDGLAGPWRGVVNELVAFSLGHAFRCGGRLARLGSRLLPRFAAIVGALNDLTEPAAGLRRVQPVWIGRRALEMIHLPARKVRAADIPVFALAV